MTAANHHSAQTHSSAFTSANHFFDLSPTIRQYCKLPDVDSKTVDNAVHSLCNYLRVLFSCLNSDAHSSVIIN